MESKRRKLAVSTVAIILATLSLAAYFTFAAVQGEFGVFRRLQVEAQANALTAELTRLQVATATMQNKTRRMSDTYLDLDLLDEQARKVLGLVRGDEIVIR
ncbi:MAG: septum formation initiator family protein [Rhodobacteraceae bacterium]|nr:septum formation initiator family protein [Paracoccaceae bacterium]